MRVVASAASAVKPICLIHDVAGAIPVVAKVGEMARIISSFSKPAHPGPYVILGAPVPCCLRTSALLDVESRCLGCRFERFAPPFAGTDLRLLPPLPWFDAMVSEVADKVPPHIRGSVLLLAPKCQFVQSVADLQWKYPKSFGIPYVLVGWVV